MNSKVVAVSSVILVLFSLILLFFVYFSPGDEVLVEENSSAQEEVDLTQLDSYQAVVNGMEVFYSTIEDSQETEQASDVTQELKGAVCEISIKPDYLAETTSPVFGILGALARCYGEAELGFPTENLDDDVNFINRWIQLYIAQCDRKLEPLGLPANDGQCNSIPMFETALLN